MNYVIGTYTRCIFSNDSNGYTVGNLKVKETDIENSSNTILFVGTFPELKLMANYKMIGEITRHPKYGKQFNVSSYELLLPTKKDELIEFFSSDLFPIGEKMATKIVDLLGEKTIDIISKEPERLKEIPRMGESKIKKIQDILVNYRASSQIVMDLSGMGFTTRDALAIYKKYENRSLDVVRDNIYELIEELGMNFKNIDIIANKLNIDKLDERRLEALIVYMFNELTFESGDTYLLYEDIYNYLVREVKDIDSEKIEYMLLKLNTKKRIIIKGDKYYLKEFYDAEEYIRDRLCFLNDIENRSLPKLDSKIKELEGEMGIIYDETQKKAINMALNNNLTIITGGPGTGKTTIINAIVELYRKVFKAKDEEIALLAPTGRASKKMMEHTGIIGSTIHRYLGWDMDKNMFSVSEYNPNPEKYIIVDEVSMLDTMLMEALLKGIRRDAKLVLVGDYYQLPSVGQGQVLKDIIDSEVLDVVYLNYLYRQNEDSYITVLANEIKNQELSEAFIMKKDDYNFVEAPNESVLMTIENIVSKAIKKGYSDKDIQVLAPMYKSLNGIDNLNKILQKLFNGPTADKNELMVGDIVYRVGDKILQLVNDPDNSVYIGDIGYVTDILTSRVTKLKKNEIIVEYDDNNKVTYTPDKFINIRHGYAISVHKAQGSEFPMVIMPIVNTFNRMMYNKLIYTAVTRAKKSLILVGDRNSFVYGVRNNYVDMRRTTLKEMFIDKYNL